MATTEAIAGYVVSEVLGVVSGVSTHPLSPFESGIKTLGTYDRAPKGGTVPMPRMLEIMNEMRVSALVALSARAAQAGANAVIAVRYDHRQVTPVWVEVCAYGTAVVLTPQPPKP
jgi:uncharacterized protein YbjQ (UPF0145 family)